MKSFLALIIFGTFLGFQQDLSAQDIREVDYQKVKRNITKKNSELYYQYLFDSYAAYDSELNSDQYFHIYFGSILTELYHVNASIPTSIMNLIGQESISRDELLDLERKLLEARKKDFYNPEILWFLFYVNSELQKADSLEIIKSHYVGILSSILSTGSGKTALSPIHLIHENHVNAILEFYELKAISKDLIDEDILKIRVEENTDEISELFFDLSAYHARKKSFKEEKKHKPKVKLVVNNH